MTHEMPGHRQTAYALLDMVSAFDPSADDNDAVLTLAFSRLNEVGAVSATESDDMDDVSLDISPLLNAYGFTTALLIGALAEKTGHDKHTIIALLREQIG